MQEAHVSALEAKHAGLEAQIDEENHRPMPDMATLNRPGAPELIYGNGFFPFPRAVEVRQDEPVEVRLRADLVKDDYVWTWTGDFRDQGIRFRQSTFYGVALSAEQLRKKHAQGS